MAHLLPFLFFFSFFFHFKPFFLYRSNCSNFNRISRHLFLVHKNRVHYTNRKFDWLRGYLPWTYIHCFFEVQKHSVILIKIYANVKGGSVLEGSLHKTNLIKTELKRILFICPRDEKEPKLTFVSPSARDRVDISSGIISRGFQPLDISYGFCGRSLYYTVVWKCLSFSRKNQQTFVRDLP